MDTFGQILELDEDDTHDFSKEMVDAFFSQASTTFEDMDKALYVCSVLVDVAAPSSAAPVVQRKTS
jgi:hypothetical protein